MDPESPGFDLLSSFYCWKWMHCCCYSVVSHVQLSVTPWTAARQAPLSFTISWSFLKLMSIELMMPLNHLILCCPLLLPSFFPSIRVFPNEWALHIRWAKFRSFSISPSNEYLGLLSFRIDCFDLLAVQRTLEKNQLRWNFWKSKTHSFGMYSQRKFAW